MKIRNHRFLLAVLAMSLESGPALAQAAPDPAHPVISGFGAIAVLPDAANQPDAAVNYRTVFNVTKAAAKPEEVNPSLDRVARFVNLLGSKGVKPAPGALVAVVHGPATQLIMSDAAYQARFGRANPNTALIAALKRAGVEIHVCGQALRRAGIEPASVSREVTVDLAAMVTLATLQLRGWALIPD
ncbi:MAG: DsrE family protein [Sphingobium sp.]